MATLSHPAPLAPRKRMSPRIRTARRVVARPEAASAVTPAAEPAAAPSTYTRSALPLALSWFAIPAILLVLSLAFGWHL